MTLLPTTLIFIAVLLLLAITTPMINPLFRRPKVTQPEDTDDETGVPISILLVARGNHVVLDEHLPIFLTQEYGPGYEVVVVSDKSDDDTGNVLKRYANNPHLYSTFIPDSSRYMSKNKLGVTLGVKAAKNEWIIMVDPSCKPDSSHWLSAMSRQCHGSCNMILGYTHFNEDTPRSMGFEHLHNACYLLREVELGHPYRTNCNVLAFRKEEFLNGQGFQGNLKYTIGEYDFMVNKFGRKGTTVTECAPAAWLTENTPSKRSWQNRNVYYQEVRKHIGNGRHYQMVYCTDMFFMYLTYLLEVIGIYYGALFRDWIVLGASCLCLLLTILLRTRIGLKTCHDFGTKVRWYELVPFELSLLWRRLATMIRYEYADKNDFISQKV